MKANKKKRIVQTYLKTFANVERELESLDEDDGASALPDQNDRITEVLSEISSLGQEIKELLSDNQFEDDEEEEDEEE